MSSAAEGYDATPLRELIHWTSPQHRCDRDIGKRFGDNSYAREELVAEIGAAFLCADLGIRLEPRPDHAAYLTSCLSVLKSDKRAIFAADALAHDLHLRAGRYSTGLVQELADMLETDCVAYSRSLKN